MKIGGKKISTPKPLMCAIPRADGEDIIFQCGAVLDYDEFDKRCPEQNAPVEKDIKTGAKTSLRDDPGYLKKMDK